MLIRRMKPLDFTLEEMRDVLEALDLLGGSEIGAARRRELVERLDMYRDAVKARVTALRDQLESAEEFAGDLRREITRQKRLASQDR